MSFLVFSFVFFLAIPLVSIANTATSKPGLCLNQPGNQRKIIFFSGILSSQNDSTRKNYEEVLKKIAHESKVSFFMPQNARPCSSYKNSYCWPRHDRNASMKLIQDQLDQAKVCFEQTEDIEFHGHSNGAYFLFDLVQECSFPSIKTAVLIAGGSRSSRKPTKKVLQNCKQNLYFAAGEQDKIFLKLKVLAEELRKDFAGTVQFIQIPGGHDLRADQYKKILKESTTSQ